MNQKKISILSVFLVFIFSALFHNIYLYFPSFLTSLFFPVNESIFEHMKLIFLSYLIVGFIEYILLKHNNLSVNNLKPSIIFSIIFNIIFLLIVYTIIYKIIGHNTIITLITYFISIIITKILAYKILTNKKSYNFLNEYFYIIIILIFLILVYFTYAPLENTIFIDYMNKKIGLDNYY